MSTKIINKLKVHGENTTQKYTDAQFSALNERKTGAQPGTAVSSKLINTSLRQSTLVTTALIDALKVVVPDNNDITSSITVGSDTTLTQLTAALTDALAKLRIERSLIADDVASGTIVSNSEFAQKAKQGFGLSKLINNKLNFKGAWIGTHKNNDVVYYNTGKDKGYYIVTGLTEETRSSPAGTIVFTGVNTPTSQAANLERLTIETPIGTDTSLTTTTTVTASSTNTQLPSAKSVYTALSDLQSGVAIGSQAKIEAASTDGTQILSKSTTAGTLTDLGKITSITSINTNMQIPTAKSVYDYAQNKVPATTTTKTKILTKSTTKGVFDELDKSTSINDSSTDNQIPTAKSVYTMSELMNDSIASLTDSKQDKIPAGTTNQIMIRTATEGTTGSLTKVVAIGESASDYNIPTEKAVKLYTGALMTDLELALDDLTDETLSIRGGTMLGVLNMNSYTLAGIKTPTADAMAANKKYVDDKIAAIPASEDGTMVVTNWDSSTKVLTVRFD